MRTDVEVSNGMISVKRKKYPVLPINRVRPIILELAMKLMRPQ